MNRRRSYSILQSFRIPSVAAAAFAVTLGLLSQRTGAQSYVFQTLAAFSTASGTGPTGLITDGAGNFYGTTTAGGTAGSGTVFQYSASSGLTALASFGSGIQANGDLVIDGAGNLYGTEQGNGSSSSGSIFSYLNFAQTGRR